MSDVVIKITPVNDYNVYVQQPEEILIQVSSVGAQGKDGVGVIAGGTTNQILAKKSNVDYDTKWQGVLDNLGFTPENIANKNIANGYCGLDSTDRISSIHSPLGVIDSLSTGLLTGGIITQGSDNTKFNISAGAGIIVDNFTDPLNPVKTLVQWNNIVDYVDTTILLTDVGYINFDVNGNIVLKIDPLTDIERRSFIATGWIDHTGDIPGVNFTYTEPFYNAAIQSQLNDFIENFGAFNIEGNIYQPLSLLTVQRSAGRTFDGNANYINFKRDPHVVTTEIESPVQFRYYYQNPANESLWNNNLSNVTNIDPNHWDDGTGTLATVLSGKFTIQLISFYAPTIINDIQYGQVQYDSLALAISSLRVPVMINPYNSYDTFRAWLIVQQGCIDLTNASKAAFISAGKLGMVDAGSGSIGGSGGEVNTASNIGTTGIGFFKQKVGVDLQFKNIEASSSKISIIEDVPHFMVSIDAVEANIVHQNLSGHGTNSHSDIDTALSRLANTSGINTNDETSTTIKSKLGISTLSGSNTGDETATTIGALINGATAKLPPIDADKFPLWDSVTGLLKYVLWSGIKSVLKSYFDLSYAPIGAASVSFNPSSPTNLSGTALTMFGLGSTLKITPLKTGKVRFFINFNPTGIGTPSGPATYKLAYGTGTAPVNAASATGTIFDNADSGSNNAASVSAPSVSFVHNFIISGLTVGTAYWFDVQGQKGASSTSVGMTSIRVTIEELPY
jgi:hypothetical protein